MTVDLQNDGAGQVRCEVLETGQGSPLVLEPGDHVLAWFLPGGADGVVIGRIGVNRQSPTTLEGSEADAPDTLVLEAKHSLTLRVGAGSITIREDGKILIKGKDLVSHAQRLNRIKGGTVQIN
ncbi:MAG TPA: hypothetical protein VGQ06_03265 [Gemmatimonadales bacterium]|nr:hypothetical protein [Gemmatimonadales bacterium]